LNGYFLKLENCNYHETEVTNFCKLDTHSALQENDSRVLSTHRIQCLPILNSLFNFIYSLLLRYDCFLLLYTYRASYCYIHTVHLVVIYIPCIVLLYTYRASYCYIHTVHLIVIYIPCILLLYTYRASYCFLFIICTNKCPYIYQITLQAPLHVSVPLHHLQGTLIMGLLKLRNIKIIEIRYLFLFISEIIAVGSILGTFVYLLR
jgi:hypothetical protein